MSVIAAALRELMAAGVEGEALVEAVARIEASCDPELAPRQARNKRYYVIRKERLKASEIKTVKTHSDASPSPPASPSDGSPTPPPITTPSPTSSPPLASLATASDDWPPDFREQFWQAYPRRTEKQTAIRALERIRKSGKVTFAALMQGVHRYAAAMRDTEPRYVKQPPTWLNAGCWEDDPKALATGPPQTRRPLTPSEMQKAKSDAAINELRASIRRDREAAGRSDSGILPEDHSQRTGDISDRPDGTPDDSFDFDSEPRSQCDEWRSGQVQVLTFARRNS